MVISCIDRGWAWLEVARELSPLAPFLAPPTSLPSLIPESAKGSLTGQSRLHTARRGHTERHRKVLNDCRLGTCRWTPPCTVTLAVNLIIR
jgi:hypothetical protein